MGTPASRRGALAGSSTRSMTPRDPPQAAAYLAQTLAASFMDCPVASSVLGENSAAARLSSWP